MAATSVAAPMPVLVRPEGDSSLEAWATESAAWIDDTLLREGAVLFRGFDVDSAAAFGRISPVLLRQPVDYIYRSTPRTRVGDRIYTATEYRADASIPFHNENAYQRDWPMRVAFCCLQAPLTGGGTPLARTARVTARIDPRVREAFAVRGVMYVRNYGHGVDLTWQTTFQTDSRAEVEAFCARESIEWKWLPDDRLRTRQMSQGMARHPVTGQELWFNQAHLFHVSSLGEEQASIMLELFGEADLPRHAYFGDGARIDPSMLAHVREAYDAERISFSWEAGDVLLVDNMLVAHARDPYTGSRQVLVAMGDLHGRYVSSGAIA